MTRDEVVALRLATGESDEVLAVLNLAEAGDESAWTKFVPLRAQIGHDDARRISDLIGSKLLQAKLNVVLDG